MAEVSPLPFDGRKLALVSAAIAVLGFVALGIGLAVDPARAWLSYLMAFVFVLAISIGGLILLMIGYAANGRWMAVVRRPIEVLALPLPALAVLFVPILFGLSLYPWHTPPAGLEHRELEILAHRAPYMNGVFFAVRAAIYFAVFLVASELLRRWSVRRDREPPAAGDADPEALLGRERRLSSAMLPPVGLALTFAAMDWIMALQPIWYSSIFGIYVFAGGFLAAIGLVTALAARMWARHGDGGALTPNHFHALGRLMFAFTVFWAYSAFFQAMLIRIANKPEEITFYIQRIGGAWGVLVWILILGHFVLPFLVLMPKGVKFRPRVMAAAGVWLVVMELVDVYWLVIPARVQGVMVFHWLDLAALAAVGGTAVAVAAWRQHKISLIPHRDPFLPDGAKYRSNL
ncbi:MAG TPA: hypothetical protein VN253_15825 [Kofleriaceae bacterium]|nr:hypothetical protein [Kofleriaceae bacterium]